MRSIRGRYRYSIILLKQLVVTDFKLRYQGSVLGYAWSLLRPILLFLVLYLVLVQGLKFGASIPHFPVILLVGIVMWNFFAEMTSLSLSSVVNRGDLIRKIRIPRWIIIVSTSVTALINLGLNLLVVLVFMYFDKVNFMQSSIWMPFVLAQLYIISLGLSLFLAAAFVKYRDISYIWEVVMQAGFYVTPIIYDLRIIENVMFQKILLINPVATAMQDARYLLISHSSPTINSVYGGHIYRLLPYGITLLALLVGFLYFRREAKYFAENL